MRLLLLVIALLATTAWGAVIPDGSTLPQGDQDAPVNLALKKPKNGTAGPNGYTVAQEKAANSSTSANPTGNASPGGAAAGPGAGKGTPGAPAATPGAPGGGNVRPNDLDLVSMRNGQPIPWALLVLAALLFGLAFGGGYYFYQNRDED